MNNLMILAIAYCAFSVATMTAHNKDDDAWWFQAMCILLSPIMFPTVLGMAIRRILERK